MHKLVMFLLARFYRRAVDILVLSYTAGPCSMSGQSEGIYSHIISMHFALNCVACNR